jgi:pentose-5-phosphate-3-epimerase
VNEEAQKWLDEYEERAAIIQFDGGYSREAAEQFAFEDVMDAIIAAKNLTDEGLIERYRERLRSLVLR